MQALKLTEQYPDRHKLVRYESLVKNTELDARAIFEFLQIGYAKQTEDFIKLSHSRHDNHKHSVYKNPALKSKWQEKLAPTIIADILAEISGTELEQFVAES